MNKSTFSLELYTCLRVEVSNENKFSLFFSSPQEYIVRPKTMNDNAL